MSLSDDKYYGDNSPDSFKIGARGKGLRRLATRLLMAQRSGDLNRQQELLGVHENFIPPLTAEIE